MSVEINLDDIQAQISQMDEATLRAQLLEIKTKQRITTKKYYNPEAAKVQRQKRAQLQAAMVAKAKELGLYDQILAEAGAAADAALAGEEVADTE